MSSRITRRSLVGGGLVLLGCLCAERIRLLNAAYAQGRETLGIADRFEVSPSDPEASTVEAQVTGAVLLSAADTAKLLAWASGSASQNGEDRCVVVSVSAAAPADIEALLANLHLESGACAWDADRQTTASLFYQRGQGASSTHADLAFILTEDSCTAGVWARLPETDFELVYALWPVRGSVRLGHIAEGPCPDLS